MTAPILLVAMDNIPKILHHMKQYQVYQQHPKHLHMIEHIDQFLIAQD